MTTTAAFAVAPTPAELQQAQTWFAERFSSSDQARALSGLLVHHNHGMVQRNARGDRPMHLGAEEHTRGLYCHAVSEVEVRLPEPGRSFAARVGVDSNDQTSGGRGSVVFSVQVGGETRYQSPLLREGMPPQAVSVDLAGARSFTLQVGDGGDGISCDQSDWAEAKVTLAGGGELWLADLPFLRPAVGEPPFSFTYAGKPSGPLLAAWPRTDQTQRLDDARTQRTLTWHDPATGLQVRCVAVAYADFPVVEWTVYFRNTGAADLPLLEGLQGLDLRLERGVEREFVLHGMKGDSCTPDSYEPFSLPLGPGSVHRFAPAGGRPTTGAYPLHNLEWFGGSMILGVGWPGQWAMSFERDADRGLHVQAGQELTHLVLRPGEEVRTPLTVLMLWQGEDRVRAQNLWRRWMVAHNIPRPHGKPPAPIYCFCSGGFFPGLKCSEAGERQFMDVLTREGIKLDYWWMDAGWYPCNDWADGVGTWEPDPGRFPHGIKAVSDYAHARGAGLVVWFEPERVVPGTWLYRQHPEWLLGGEGTKLLNLGHPAARAWLTDHVDTLLREQGIDLYRQDFNMDPLGYWRANDPPTRQGMTENLHVQGYLAYWDELRRRHPDMLIDSCASGGRRDDLETLRRAVPLLRSDYQSFSGDPSFAPGNQGHTYGLASWVPYFGTGVYYSPDRFVYCVRSYMTPAFGIAVDARRTDFDWSLYRRLVAQWREVSDCFIGDFYPLTAYSLDDGAWMAWQFDLPEQGKGFVAAFRHDASPYLTADFPLRGLDPAARYRVRSLDEEKGRELPGRELMEPGLRVEVRERPGAVILKYEKLN